MKEETLSNQAKCRVAQTKILVEMQVLRARTGMRGRITYETSFQLPNL